MALVEAVLGLVALAVTVAAVAKQLRTPAPSLLVVAGLVLGFLPGLPSPTISPRLVTLGVLPPLLFAAAQRLSLPMLRSVWDRVAVLAVGLVAVTAAAVAWVARALDPALGLAPAFVLGAILASTDPVAVSALSRRLRLPERVTTIVQAESLFNDATSLVMFQVAVLAVTAPGGSGPGTLAVRFVELAGGGLLIGLVSGGFGEWLTGRSHEAELQATIALLIPYVAAVGAEAAQVSPVTAVIVAGLTFAHRGRAAIDQPGRRLATGVYDVLVFVLESLVFAVIGLELAAFIRELPSSDRSLSWELLIAVPLTLLAVRAAGLSVEAMVSAVAAGGRPPRRRPWSTAAVVTWAGARGVVPLAAALAVPLTAAGGSPFPHRQLLMVVTAGTVVISLVVQGSTLEPLVRRLGLDTGRPAPPAATRPRERAHR